MSIAQVVTRGFGTFGTASKVVTRGYGAGAAVASSHSPYYSEFSYLDGKLEQRFPWGKRKTKRNKQDEQDIQDILSALPWDKL